jgi:hypothetical protein
LENLPKCTKIAAPARPGKRMSAPPADAAVADVFAVHVVFFSLTLLWTQN